MNCIITGNIWYVFRAPVFTFFNSSDYFYHFSFLSNFQFLDKIYFVIVFTILSNLFMSASASLVCSTLSIYCRNSISSIYYVYGLVFSLMILCLSNWRDILIVALTNLLSLYTVNLFSTATSLNIHCLLVTKKFISPKVLSSRLFHVHLLWAFFLQKLLIWRSCFLKFSNVYPLSFVLKLPKFPKAISN